MDQSRYDIFLSYASEDRHEIAAPLTQALMARGLRVWSDERMLNAGAELSHSIAAGLSRCSYGVVILSPAYMSPGKYWPRQELQGLIAREEEEGSLIIPVWHKVGRQDVIAFNPPLAGRKPLVSAAQSLDEMSEAILRVVRAAGPQAAAPPPFVPWPPAVQAPEPEPHDEPAEPAPPPQHEEARPEPSSDPEPDLPPETRPALSRPAGYRLLGFPSGWQTISAQEIDELIESGATGAIFQGYSIFSRRTAALLARWSGAYLQIDHLWGLDTVLESLEELARWPGESLVLGLSSLTPEMALALSKWPGTRLEIRSLGELTPAAAVHLAAWPGEHLILPDLSHLTAEAAAALSQWPGRELSLLKSYGKLTPEAAERLSAWQGRILVMAQAVGPAQAEHLARWQGQVLDLRGLSSLSAASARALYRWRGNEIRLFRLGSLSSAALHYLNQWGKESERVWRRRPNLPLEPEEFGFIPALRRVWAGTAEIGSSSRHALPKIDAHGRGQGEPPVKWRSLISSAGSSGLFLLAAISLLVWLLNSSWVSIAAAFLQGPQVLEPTWWRNTLRVLGFVTRLVLSLLPPLLTAFLAVALEPYWLKLVEDKEHARRLRIRGGLAWTGLNISSTGVVLWASLGVFFPGFLTLASLRRALAESSGGTVLAEDGFWHGLLHLPRIFLVGFPPHAEAAGVWLVYLLAYFMGLAVSFIVFLIFLHAPLTILTGFDSRKSAYVIQQSHSLDVIIALAVLYAAWCLVLLIWAVGVALLA